MLRLSHILTTAALVAVCAAPASAATFEQLHSDSSKSQGQAYVLNRDYGSPDRVDTARDVPWYVLNRDYGSPDAADAARDLPPVQTAVLEPRDASGGFDWGDAGIGAAGMLALFSIAAGSALMLTGRKRRHGIA
jgi:hypothetical protein